MIENRTMFTGDNLPILRGMADESVDLIYLDPPFNKNQTFAAPIGSKSAGAAFKDAWTLKDTDDIWWSQILDSNPDLYNAIGSVSTADKSSKAYMIYMGVRLLEMKRILKTMGSIYLHCDPTMSHYLKVMMDAIFGAENFRNEIIWRYGDGGRGAKARAKQFPRNHDVILLYGSKKSTHNKVYKDIRYPITDLPSHIRVGEGGIPYKTSPRGDYTDESIKRLEKEGRIHKTSRGGIRIKYILERKGDYVIEKKLVGDTWTDIPDMMHAPKVERTGYPTQKPLALLTRIVESSSNIDDVVLDPFCGCATASLASEAKKRQWIGIDISPAAVRLVKDRIEKELKGLFRDIHARTDIPQERGGKRSPDKVLKEYLYGKQGGNCCGCNEHFKVRHLTLDHFIPRAGGGPDIDANIQLLCGACNSMKGDRPMDYLRARLKQLGLVGIAP